MKKLESRLQVERLEDRRTPATLTFTPSTGTLVYHGDAVGHDDYFLDNGQGTVTAYILGGGGTNGGQYATFTGVKTFQSYDGTGPDDIDYYFTGPVKNTGSFGYSYGNQDECLNFVVTGGSKVTLNALPGVAQGSLQVFALGYKAGFTANFGPVAAGASLYMATTDYGAFNVIVNQTGAVAGFSEIYCQDYGYGGGGSYSVNCNCVITGTVYIYAFSHDTGGINSYDFELTAAAGSTGQLDAYLTTQGNDPSTLNVFDNSGGALRLDADLTVSVLNTDVHHTDNVVLSTY